MNMNFHSLHSFLCPSIFAYNKKSKTGGGNGLGMRLHTHTHAHTYTHTLPEVSDSRICGEVYLRQWTVSSVEKKEWTGTQTCLWYLVYVWCACVIVCACVLWMHYVYVGSYARGFGQTPLPGQQDLDCSLYWCVCSFHACVQWWEIWHGNRKQAV